MTLRERILAVLHGESYDQLPVLHFAFWGETLEKWADEGHLTRTEAAEFVEGGPIDDIVCAKLGFDSSYHRLVSPTTFLDPPFEVRVLEKMDNGFVKMFNEDGAIVLAKPGTTSIPAEVDHTLKTRKDWEEHYVPRLRFSEERVNRAMVRIGDTYARWDEGGRDHLLDHERDTPLGLHCGSLFGKIRDTAGLVGVSYIWADDDDLFTEMIDTVGDLCYRCTETALASGVQFDYAHFWEDICFRSGPLIVPEVFAEKVGPHYKRITDLVRRHGIDIVSLDCDGFIDDLVPVWFNNAVNTMFPIEVGTWNASIAPWREKYGDGLKGVGGMDKRVFARDRAAIDTEIERLARLVDLGGYLPCPDHRIAPDAKWDNVRYYCDKMHEVFS